MKKINIIVVIILLVILAVLGLIGFSREGTQGINFREKGRVVLGGDDRLPSVWYIIYAETETPGLELQLAFNETSKCKSGGVIVECGTILSQDAKAEIAGFRVGDVLIVKEFRLENDRAKGLKSKTVQLYYYSAEKDKDSKGNILCGEKGLSAVDRSIPEGNIIADTIRLLIKGEITYEERVAGIESEFPLPGFTFVDSVSDNGTLTLIFLDPENKTSGGLCRASLLWSQIEKTAKQFSEVRSVKFLPEDLFQP